MATCFVLEKTLKVLEFGPFKVGLGLLKSGLVTSVKKGSQAMSLGVETGWKIVQVHYEPYCAPRLKELAQ